MMDLNTKSYQILKLKKYFKNNDFFFLFHSAKLNSVKWLNTEQNLKKLKLGYYKPLNRTSVKTLQNSIYKNFTSSIGGFILFVNSLYKDTELNLQNIVKNLKPSFALIGIKLNNKIYSTSQLKGMKDLSYKRNVFTLHQTLDKYLKTSYTLTNKGTKK
jgi:hypothetical protein|uniref:Ribosomal protein L10 n=1 Tax=Tryblionella apiculata TaxID=1003145 RepID=A0A8F0WGT9_9STRA|nr:hypothetical protein KYU77_mgp27 [Tryblionella apiculata]QWM93607.1 hypothetical protein [Tryblionella apiculata]